MLHGDLKVISTSNTFYREFHLDQGETLGQLNLRAGQWQWYILELHKLLESVLINNDPIKKYHITNEFYGNGPRNLC